MEEEYSKGSVEVEDNKEVEEAHDDHDEQDKEDSSSSDSSSDAEEVKVVSDSVELSQDVEPSPVDKGAGESDVAELDTKETEPFYFTSGEATRDSQLLTDVGSEETMLPGFNGVVADQEAEASDNVEDLLQAASVTILETRDADELVDKPDIHESMEDQPIIPTQRAMQPNLWKSCCGLFEVLRRSDR